MPSSQLFTQKDRALRIHSPLDPDTLLVQTLEAEERLSELFRIHLHLLAPRQTLRGQADADTGDPLPLFVTKLLGQPLALDLAGTAGKRSFHGIVREVVQIEDSQDPDFFHFDVELVPTLWLATQRVRSQVFQRQSVPDILNAVLAELRPDLEIQLNGKYPVRDYCVQYRESDFAFISRLMEEEGISYYFRHEVSGSGDQASHRHVLVLLDHATAFTALPSGGALRYDDARDTPPGAERVSAWKTMQQVRRQVFLLRDQHFELPDTASGRPLRLLQAATAVAGDATLGRLKTPLTVKPLHPASEPLESYEHNTGFARRFESETTDNLQAIFDDQPRVARLRQEEETAAAIRIDATASYPHLEAGRLFTVEHLGGKDGTYLLTALTHTVSQAGFRSGEEASFTYQCRFQAVPEGLPVRPARKTARPKIEGTQTAIVCGAAGKEVDVDALGRVKVQFYWDRADQYNQNSSCWVRVSQLWAGDRWGAFFWPRAGMEVIVTFEDGDPDRPIITGCVYNAASMPPARLPDKAAFSGIVSSSVDGAGKVESNAIVFNDTLGNEHLLIHSPNDEARVNRAASYRYNAGPNVEFLAPPSIFADMGSGSGGGLVSGLLTADNWKAQTDSGSTTESFKDFWIDARLPTDSKAVVGDSLYVNFRGTKNTHNLFAPRVEYNICPAAAFWDRVPLPASMFRYGVFGGMVPVGVVDLTLSPKITQLYFGVKTEIQRCPKTITYTAGPITLKGNEDPIYSVAILAAMGLLTATLTATDAMAICLHNGWIWEKLPSDATAQQTADRKYWQNMGALWGNFIVSRTHGLLYQLEKRYAELGATRKKLEAAKQEAKAVADMLEYNLLHLTKVIGVGEEVVQEATKDLNTAMDCLEDSLAGKKSNEESKLNGTEMKEAAAPYCMSAPRLTMVAVPNEKFPLGSIVLSAPGKDESGHINLHASGTVNMFCGGQSIGLSALNGDSPTAYINSPPSGKITLLQSGRGEQLASITMEGSDGSITLKSGELASILLKPGGIQLKFGEWSLVLNTSGIHLSAGTQAINVTPAEILMNGLNMKTNAEIGWENLAASAKDSSAVIKEESFPIKKE